MMPPTMVVMMMLLLMIMVIMLIKMKHYMLPLMTMPTLVVTMKMAMTSLQACLGTKSSSFLFGVRSFCLQKNRSFHSFVS